MILTDMNMAMSDKSDTAAMFKIAIIKAHSFFMSVPRKIKIITSPQ